jgi:hypothetical protein
MPEACCVADAIRCGGVCMSSDGGHCLAFLSSHHLYLLPTSRILLCKRGACDNAPIVSCRHVEEATNLSPVKAQRHRRGALTVH